MFQTNCSKVEMDYKWVCCMVIDAWFVGNNPSSNDPLHSILIYSFVAYYNKSINNVHIPYSFLLYKYLYMTTLLKKWQ